MAIEDEALRVVLSVYSKSSPSTAPVSTDLNNNILSKTVTDLVSGVRSREIEASDSRTNTLRKRETILLEITFWSELNN